MTIDEEVAAVAAWQALADRVTVGGPLPLRVRINAVVYEGNRRVMAMAVPVDPIVESDCTRGEPKPFPLNANMLIDGPPNERTLFEVCLRLYAHELAEFFRVDNVKVFNPHQREGGVRSWPDGAESELRAFVETAPARDRPTAETLVAEFMWERVRVGVLTAKHVVEIGRRHGDEVERTASGMIGRTVREVAAAISSLPRAKGQR